MRSNRRKIASVRLGLTFWVKDVVIVRILFLRYGVKAVPLLCCWILLVIVTNTPVRSAPEVTHQLTDVISHDKLRTDVTIKAPAFSTVGAYHGLC